MRTHFKELYKKQFPILFCALIILIHVSCSVKKYIPEGELLYTGGEIHMDTKTKIKGEKAIKEELNGLLRPESNSKFLGVRWGLLSHYKSQKKHPGFINKFFNKRIGEEPVYLSDVDIQKTEELINNRLENRGFYKSIITSEVTKKRKKASAAFHVSIGKPYQIETYTVNGDSLAIYDSIQNSLKETVLNKNSRFDLALLKDERERVDHYLKERGYYNFNDDFLLFEADTNQYQQKKIDLFLKIKEEAPEKSKIPYKLNSIQVYPDYSVNKDSILKDTIHYKGIDYIQNTSFFKPERLAPFILFEKGQYYSPTRSKHTSNRLSKIGTYKYTTIRFEDVKPFQEGDSVGLLNAKIYLSPMNKHSLRAEVQANSKSNNYIGPALALSYSNRNLFRGGELFNTTISFGYEKQIAGGADNAGLTSTQLGFRTDLIFPRILFPFKFDLGFDYEVPKTKVSTGIEYLSREEFYVSTSFIANFGYTWNANQYVYHELIPIGFNYSSLYNTSEAFNDLLEANPFLKNSFEQKFIAGLSYNFVYNEISNTEKRTPIYLSANFKMAGNMLDLISGKPDEKGRKKIFGLEYAQFVKADVDLRYQYKIDKKQALIARVFGGVGLAYGNSISMPYSEQYYSGGPFSVRAFRIRSLGPGTYNIDAEATEETPNNKSYLDQTGDIRLEANLEYRFPLFSYLKGALFADAGNVWLLKENPAIPGGKISSGFLKELGVGIGTGLRVDVQSFVIRFDLAVPIHKPYQEQYNLDLRKPVLNFAFGYPF